jgi:formylglycine-generating enzyme required for sulfatase activity
MNSLEEMRLICIDAGPFTMGTSQKEISILERQDDLARKWKIKGWFSREQPQHTVSLTTYLISKYPVTVGEYRKFMNANGYQTRAYWTEAGWLWVQSVRVHSKWVDRGSRQPGAVEVAGVGCDGVGRLDQSE